MKHTIHFYKMQGLGNDFVVIDGINQRLNDLNPSDLALRLCHRRYGIGADGLILCLPSAEYDVSMHFYNADGSQAELCGNGIRCLAAFAYTQGLVEKEVFSVETPVGVKLPALILENGRIKAIEVDMGVPQYQADDVPCNLRTDDGRVIDSPISVLGQDYVMTAIGMGNPHAVFFVDNIHDVSIERFGPAVGDLGLFPKGVNVEVAQVIDSQNVAVQVWERGVGVSQACGTGACAVVVAGVLTNRLNPQSSVQLPGGILSIDWQGEGQKILMTGPAQQVFSGDIQLAL
ncbi:MAG: diaminopimelate epimerase [bacterium]